MAEHIHLIAACGTGMGTLACILKEMGHKVSGSDANIYPPMSDFLAEKGIALFNGYDASNLNPAPDLVIIGNAVTRENPEAVEVMKKNIPYLSMPEAVNRFVARDKKIILVTGTHGKTTTSSIMAHILYMAGLDPSFMVGGILKDFNSSFRIGSGEFMVIEGDEYDTAFFDKGPKFMHYDPWITIITGIEFDHADIFRDLDHIKKIFSDFVAKIEKTSHLIVSSDNKTLSSIMTDVQGSVETYGEHGQWSFSDYRVENTKSCFIVNGPGSRYTVSTGLMGRHNMCNCTACIAVAQKAGINTGDVLKALETFSGVKRRQEIRGGRNGITIMDDFAHHPTAVRETIAAVKPFYSRGRIIAVFEPRTNTSMRNVFQGTYPEAFREADMVCICEPGVKKNIPEEQKFSTEQLVADINGLGICAHHFDSADSIVDFLVPKLEKGDLVLVMSNGGFDNIHIKLLENIE
jgi:UDP-N-acetylmuramate: L-alanyl-gamma-D-glutamyl-meso-diaminopimelate ligase